ncbi:ABC transporter related protein [Halothece sp. PCC 7418]|uniref:ABC transporter ATP-binding protein n=1 Tax=Halothece sp. (strain PCC 7418) TaxID=65093 RepID=UPI0002A07284|nr:ABC transporter ATP-binding protein [Halothece sp. PCC 7418]AFZ44544.1 ABC transporter related protein [Halothece sp. PCC 7418]
MAQSRLRNLISYLRPHRKQMLMGIAALLAVNLVSAAIPLLIRDSVDQTFDNNRFWYYVVGIILLASVMWGIRMISRLLIFGVGRKVEYDLKQRIFEHLLCLEPGYFSLHTSGDLINRATSDVDNVRRLVGFAVLSVVNTVFAYTITLPFMLSIDVNLTLLAIAPYPFILIAVQLSSRNLSRQQQEVQENLSDLSQLIQEDVSGMSLIKIYAQEENEKQAFAQKNETLLRSNLKLARTRNILFPIIEALAAVSLLFLLGLGSRGLSSGTISNGDFVALIIYAQRLVFPIALLGFTITTYQRGAVSVDRVQAIFEAEPQIQDDPEAIVLPVETVKGHLEAKDLRYRYPGSQAWALQGVNFTIQPGEVVAVVGSIGAGKSTLANVLPRLLKIEAGQVFLDGYDITKIRLADLRRAIAYVPQDSFLFSTTISNNIAYGDPYADMDWVETSAKTSQIHPEILSFPKQYDTIVGERGITLSGGQRQRASLARALLVDAPVLILDDALSSVDNRTATEILNSLSAGVEGKTVIFITHQLSAAAKADRLLVMDQGQIVQMGTHEELLEVEGLYRSLWQQHEMEEVLP